MGPRIGLALSGGGSKGAFTVGVLRAIDALLSPFPYPVISGTSTGSLIGSLLTTGDLTKLVQIYSRVETEEIVQPNHPLVANLFGAEAVLFASAVLGGRSIFDTTPLENTIRDNIDFAKLKRAADKTLLVYNAVDLRSGQLTTYDNRSHAPATLKKALLASANMPVLMPPVRLTRGGRPQELVDGGVREFLPLRAVYDSGVPLDHIFAISTAPLAPKVQASDFEDITEILGRTVDLFSSEVARDDYHGALQFNAMLQMIENAGEAGVSERRILAGIPLDVRRRLRGKRSIPVTFIGPAKHIDVDALEFDPATMRRLMKDGMQVGKKAVSKIRDSILGRVS